MYRLISQGIVKKTGTLEELTEHAMTIPPNIGFMIVDSDNVPVSGVEQFWSNKKQISTESFIY